LKANYCSIIFLKSAGNTFAGSINLIASLGRYFSKRHVLPLEQFSHSLLQNLVAAVEKNN
jgi:hypothetical protein